MLEQARLDNTNVDKSDKLDIDFFLVYSFVVEISLFLPKLHRGLMTQVV